MPNWVADFLTAHPEAASRIVKRARHSLHVRRDDGQIEAHFTGKPQHYQDGNGDWQPIDTAIVDLGNGYYGAAGLIVRFNKTNRTVEIVGSGYSQRTTRVGVLRPSTMALRGTPVAVPVGSVDGDSLVASGVIGGANWEHRLRLTEDGVRETLTLASKPTLSGVAGTDYLILETAIAGATFPDGVLDEFTQADMQFPLPSAEDANGDHPNCRRYARTVAGTQYIYTGVPVAWLATAVYPVVVDPDFTSKTADGVVSGQNSVYATARSTATYHSSTSVAPSMGQLYSSGDYTCSRLYLLFDTSSIGSGTVTQVNLKLVVTADNSSTDFDVYILKQDWSAYNPLSAGNRDAAYDECLTAAQDDNIWRNTSGLSIETQYASGNLSTTWINGTGTTYYSLASNRDYVDPGTTPTGYELISIATANNPTTAYRPVLTVTYTAGGGATLVTRKSLLGVGL
jgi:hypothetical protein